MKIIDQAGDHITVYDIQQQQIRKSLRYDSLSKLMRSFSHQASQEKTIWLLDEQLFAFHRFNVSFTTEKPCSIQYIRKLIDKKIASIGNKELMDVPYVLHRLTHIVVNGQSSDFVLGHVGNISMTIELCVLTPAGVVQCELLGGSRVFDGTTHSFYPRNYYTIQYLNCQLKKRTYALLFVEQETSQLISVHEGWYKRVSYINIGLQLLKSCYQEHDIEKYFYMSRDNIEQNHFLTKVIDEAVSFFTDTLSKRVCGFVDTTQPLVVSGDIIHNPSFLTLFQDSYSAYGTGYILPLRPLQHEKYEHTFASHEITVSSYLTYGA